MHCCFGRFYGGKEKGMSVFIDEKLFAASFEKNDFKDVPMGDFSAVLQRKENETSEQYEKRSKDFELLLFLLKARNRQDILSGIPQADGSIRHISIADIMPLFGKLDDLLEGVEGLNKFFGINMLFDKIDTYREVDSGDDDLLF